MSLHPPVARLLAAIGLCALAPLVCAQPAPAWPQAKAITVVVPFAAGGAVDYAARLVTTRLAERIGQSIVVDNVAGASGVVGTLKAARSPADGYTLMVAPDTSITLTPLVTPETARYDGLKDFAPVGVINTTPYILVTAPAVPAATVSELVRYVAAHPRQLNYASPGVGNLTHVAMEQLSQQAGLQMLHVPYKSTPQMITDMIGNQVMMTLAVPSTALPHIRSGKLKALAVTGSQRIAPLPDVPTVGEAPEVKGFSVTTTIAMFAPAKTPAPIVERLGRELAAVLAMPDVRATMQEQAATPGAIAPAAYAGVLREDMARYERIVKSANIKAE